MGCTRRRFYHAGTSPIGAPYLNARSTLRTLLALDTIPVINENDTVAIDEIKFGDNDTLAAYHESIEADVLVITDQPGLFTRDPRRHPDATLVGEAKLPTQVWSAWPAVSAAISAAAAC
jgi:glutamate 5-kinase